MVDVSIASEQWRDICQWEGFYQVSNCGRVRSLDRNCRQRGGTTRVLAGRILKGRVNNCGYRVVPLSHLGRLEVLQVSRLVVRAFIGEIPPGMQVNHIDGDKTNNAVENLEIVTPSQNIAHARQTGLVNQKYGDKTANAILNDETVKAIIRALKHGTKTQAQLARDHGVNKSTVHLISKRKNWRHLWDEA